MAAANKNAPQFWRDDTLPFLEARSIEDGRGVCYASHTHEAFSVDLVMGGQSMYLNGRTRQDVRAGAIVVMNPEEVHACNPLGDTPWSYHMFYIDAGWLGNLQHELGFSANVDLQPFSTIVSYDPGLQAGLLRLYAACARPRGEQIEKETAVISCLSDLHDKLNPAPVPRPPPKAEVARAAGYITENCTLR
jgi:hypothetical protein